MQVMLVLSICTISKPLERILKCQMNLSLFGVPTVVLTDFRADAWVQPQVEFKVKFKGGRAGFCNYNSRRFAKWKVLSFAQIFGQLAF